MKSTQIMAALAAVTLSASVLVPASSATPAASEDHSYYVVSKAPSGHHVVRRVTASDAEKLRSNGITVGVDLAFGVSDSSDSNDNSASPLLSEPPTTEPPTTEPPTTNPPDISTPIIERREDVVAVLDSGVQTSNPRLAGSLLPGANFIPTSNSESEPWLDGEGHGTAVAGVVLAHNPAARILPVRVLGNNGIGTTYDLVKGIYWAVENGAGVLNLSLGSKRARLDQDPQLREALLNAVNHGVVVVAAAGNEGDEGSPLALPAAFDETISVASVNKYSKVSWFSSRRLDVDIAAVGQDVKVLSLSGGYINESGTSFSAPVVSAIASQLLTAHPEWGVTEVRNQLLATAKDIGPKGPDAAYGFGLVNAKAALAQPLGVPFGAIPAPAPFTKLKVENVQGGVVLSAKGVKNPLFVSQDGVNVQAVSPIGSYVRVGSTGEFRVWTYDKYGIPTQGVTQTFTGSEAPVMDAVAFRKGGRTYVKVKTKLPKGLRVAVSAPVKASDKVLYAGTSNNRTFEAFSARVSTVKVCFETGSEETFGCADIEVRKH